MALAKRLKLLMSNYATEEAVRQGFELYQGRSRTRAEYGKAAPPITARSEQTSTMTEISRPELDAKLDAMNARVEARLAAFENTVRDAMAGVRQDSAEVRGELKAIHVELAHTKNLKSNVWAAAGVIASIFIGSAVAIYFGIASNNQMLVSNAIAGFGAGKDIATAQAEIEHLNRQALELLNEIKTMQKPQPSTPPAPPQSGIAE